MPTIWFAKDGARPHSQFGPGIEITAAEAHSIASSHHAKFVGTEAPSFNPGNPSNSTKNVVIEIESNTQICSLFPNVGYYFIADLKPTEAERTLHTLREHG